MSCGRQVSQGRIVGSTLTASNWAPLFKSTAYPYTINYSYFEPGLSKKYTLVRECGYRHRTMITPLLHNGTTTHNGTSCELPDIHIKSLRIATNGHQRLAKAPLEKSRGRAHVGLLLHA